MQTLILDKGARKYVFRYTPGSEGQVMDQLWRLAEDERCDLDWMDAAAGTFQVLAQAAKAVPRSGRAASASRYR
jgi:hypothetical protein